MTGNNNYILSYRKCLHIAINALIKLRHNIKLQINMDY